MTKADSALSRLLEGNERFRTTGSGLQPYTAAHLHELAIEQVPFAAIIACSDSRVSPEIIFDQPLGALFVSRVPANVASDGTKWMIDLAVGSFQVPLVLVLAHTGCLAVKQIVENKPGPGGSLRDRVHAAMHHVASGEPETLYERTIVANAKKTCRDLLEESSALEKAVKAGITEVRTALYDMETGRVLVQDP